MDADVIRNELKAKELFSQGGRLPFSLVCNGRHSEDIDWTRKITGWSVDRTEWVHSLVLEDPETGLLVCAAVSIYVDAPGIDWTLRVMNGGSEPVQVTELDALDVRYEDVGKADLHRLNGSTCQEDDWLPTVRAINRGDGFAFGPERGRSSEGACPFFNLAWHDGGVITAVGWSGHWMGWIENDGGRLRLEVGQRLLEIALLSGEAIRSPRILQVYWEGDVEDSYNLFRRTMFAHILPRTPDGELVTPPIADLSTSVRRIGALDARDVLEHIEAVKGLGIEVYWIDAYQSKGGFPLGVGNYGPDVESMTDPVRFPDGLRPIRDAIDEAGMDFLLWFEPERVVPGTWLWEEHPDWVLHCEEQTSGLLNLGNPHAREYMTAFLVKAVEELRVNWLRIDFNIDPLPFWQALDEEGRRGITEMRYVEGLYAMLDEIRARYPWVKLDNCASGGRRIDLETCSRMTPLWRGDLPGGTYEHNVLAPVLNQAMTAALSRYVPFNTSGGRADAPYYFRSAFNAGIQIMDNVREAGYPVKSLKAGIEEAKRLRPYLLGDMYVLSDVTVDPTKWSVVQWHLPKKDAGIVLAFRRHESPYSTFECKMRGIDPSAEYEVNVSGRYDRRDVQPTNATRLARLRINDRPGSLLVEYRRADVPAA